MDFYLVSTRAFRAHKEILKFLPTSKRSSPLAPLNRKNRIENRALSQNGLKQARTRILSKGFVLILIFPTSQFGT
jgi:hypothetical protein